MYAGPRRNFFVIEVLKTDGNWSGRIRVSTWKDWDQTLQRYIQKYMEYLDRMK
jgi:hypothetical protein